MAKVACVGWQLRQRLDWRHTLPLQHYDVGSAPTAMCQNRDKTLPDRQTPAGGAWVALCIPQLPIVFI